MLDYTIEAKVLFLVHFGNEHRWKEIEFFCFSVYVPKMKLFRLNLLSWRNKLYNPRTLPLDNFDKITMTQGLLSYSEAFSCEGHKVK